MGPEEGQYIARLAGRVNMGLKSVGVPVEFKYDGIVRPFYGHTGLAENQKDFSTIPFYCVSCYGRDTDQSGGLEFWGRAFLKETEDPLRYVYVNSDGEDLLPKEFEAQQNYTMDVREILPNMVYLHAGDQAFIRYYERFAPFVPSGGVTPPVLAVV